MTQLNLFGESTTPETRVEKNNNLEVVNAQFTSTAKISTKELFEGYDTLYAITYSSSISMIPTIAKIFKQSYIIFGNESVLSKDVYNILAIQEKIKENVISVINNSENTDKLVELISSSNLELYVSRAINSHEKLYILYNSETNTHRVITGSANLSTTGFSGIQRENIVIFDDKLAYEYYLNKFLELKEEADYAIEPQEENAVRKELEVEDVLPPILNSSTPVILNELSNSKELNNEIQFTTDVKALAGKYKSAFPKEKISKSFILNLDKSLKIKSNLKALNNETRERHQVYPKLKIDYDTSLVSFNNKILDLNNTNEENIKNSLNFFNEFLNNYDNIAIGNIEEGKRNYYLLANWYFASPFFSYLRLVAEESNDTVCNFPMYAICYGTSNAGKTLFAKLLSKFMTGVNLPVNNVKDFLKTNIAALNDNIYGVPIVFDEMTQEKFKSPGEEIIKFDNVDLNNRVTTLPAILMTSNDIKAVKQELNKRCFVCPINISIDRTTGLNNHKLIKSKMNTITNDFYREYLNRMLPLILDMADKMRNETNYIPDIFKVSSTILATMFEEYLGFLPEYAYIATRDGDYFSAKTSLQNVKKKISNAWELEKHNFEIQRKQNRIKYTAPDNFQARYIYNELPQNKQFEPEISGSVVSFNLDAASDIFNISFKTSLLDKFGIK